MERRIDPIVLSIAIVLLLAATWLIAGCEQEKSPVTSDQELFLAPGNGNGNSNAHAKGDDEGNANAESKGKGKARGNPHTASNPTGNPHTASNPTGDPHINDVDPDADGDEEKPGKNKGKQEKDKDEDPPKEVIEYTGKVASIDGNDIILLNDDVVIYTWPGSHPFVDDDNNGKNDELEELIGDEIIVVGKPVYDEVTGDLISIYAYKIADIIIRGPGKPPWAGPKPKD